MVVLVIFKNEKAPLKIKALELLLQLSHNKCTGIFPNAQGQITPQSEVESGRKSILSYILWLSLLLPRMKKI